MDPDELDAFLNRERPARLGVVGTLGLDGSPHLVPVWYRWDGEAVTIWADEPRIWVQNLLRDGRVAFSVQEEDWPFPAVVMRGRADVVAGDTLFVQGEIRRITRRYVPEDGVEAYVARWAELETIVTIRPERITSWPAAG